MTLPTPLIEYAPNIWFKAEFLNPSGSHKIRSARTIIETAIGRGDIIPHKTTVIEKTGGNFGLALARVCADYGVAVDVAVGLSFSQKRCDYLTYLGANLIGRDMMREQGMTPKEVVHWHLENAEKLGKHYYYCDQFSNPDGVTGHQISTGAEYVQQVADRTDNKSVTLVLGAGTGASYMGIYRAFAEARYTVRGILMEPHGCNSQQGKFTDHRMEGIAVGTTPPFLDFNLVDDVIQVDQTQMLTAQQKFAQQTGYFVGNTTGGLIHACDTIRQRHPNDIILSLCCDEGLWYNDWSPA